jgi:tungstate transport system permease protein
VDLLAEALAEAWRLLTTGDGDVYEIALRTLVVTLASTVVSSAIGVPVGLWLAAGRFPGQRALVSVSNAGMGVPPVVAGLVVSILLWRSGPLGDLRMIYTPYAIVTAQVVIATPLVVAISAAGVMALPPRLHLQIRAMGAGTLRYFWLVAREARLPLLVAVMAAFGAAISEVGAAMMVGGNLAGETRVLTTAVVLEVSRGNFGTALALGIILLALAFSVIALLTFAQVRMRRR